MNNSVNELSAKVEKISTVETQISLKTTLPSAQRGKGVDNKEGEQNKSQRRSNVWKRHFWEKWPRLSHCRWETPTRCWNQCITHGKGDGKDATRGRESIADSDGRSHGSSGKTAGSGRSTTIPREHLSRMRVK